MPKRVILHVMVSSPPPALSSQVKSLKFHEYLPNHDLPSDVDPPICPFPSLTCTFLSIIYLRC